MQVGGAHPQLTEAEISRRHQEGPHLYCGGQGHLSATCPVKKQSSAKPVVKFTFKLCMCMCQHQEQLKFYLASTPHFPLVLGLEWFQAHELHTILFKAPGCRTHVTLHTETLAAKLTKESCPALPTKYADYHDIFSEKEVDQLPPHRLYDYSIDLVLIRYLYSLSEPKLATLQDFIDKNLKRGLSFHLHPKLLLHCYL
ncbi:hypothetical protein E2320_020331 [Naja naja]|nr:hypothetical protein E2320_020331 [Naja naja]